MNDTTRLLPSQLLNQDSLDFCTCCLSSMQWVSQVLLTLTYLPLCLRKTDSVQANADLLPGILRGSCSCVLDPRRWLCLWKIHGKKMEPGRGRLSFSFHAHIPSFFTGFLTSFLLQYIAWNVPAEGLVGVAMVCVHSSGRGYRFPRLRFKPLCLSQVQDHRRMVMKAFSMQPAGISQSAWTR